MIHRNTYINGPTVLRETWQTRTRDDLFFAGQISGVEGYVESAASGLHGRPQRRRAGRSARSRRAPPRTTAIGALAYYVSHADPKHYQPTNITFGIMPPLEPTAGASARRQKADRKSARSRMASARSRTSTAWIAPGSRRRGCRRGRRRE